VNAIHDLPTESTFGYDHNYSAWAPNSHVTICKVPWNSSYRDIVRFTNRAALNTYIDSAGGEVISVLDAVYLKMGQPIDLDIPFSVANTFNYLRVYNPSQPITSPGGSDQPVYFYYFVTNVEYIAPNTTRFNVQLDVWQTFGYEITFGMAFLERGHMGIAADNAFTDHGRQFLNVAEGVDIGNEYNVAQNYQHSIGSARGPLQDYDILVMTAASFSGDLGTTANPNLSSATGSMMENLPSGCEIYWIDGSHFNQFMSDLSAKPWISQAIVSITAIPNNAQSRYGLMLNDFAAPGLPSMPAGSIKQVLIGSLTNPSITLASNWRDSILNVRIPAQYRILKKLLTFPYCALEMTTYTGQPIILKPEAWDNPDIQIEENPHLIPGSARVVFYPNGYNALPGSTSTTDANGVVNDNGEFLDLATSITNFPTFSLVNNSYIAFLAGNKNSIAFQNQSADWSQQRALTGNQLSFDQASAGMDLTNKLNELNINASTQNTSLANETAGFNNIQGGLNGLASGLANGKAIDGGLAFLNSGINQAITQNQNNQALNISTNLRNSSTNAGIANAAYQRDTNKSYADYASKGDYHNAIAGITAKVQDAKLTQPTTSGQVGGDAFNLTRYHWGVDVKVKILQGSAMNTVGMYWLRFGYQMNIWTVPPADLHCMTKFTYWKLRESYITAAKCPELFKETIRGIFEKGVTVWRNPSDIGNVTLFDNAIVTGINL
jgi:hypothetical protein